MTNDEIQALRAEGRSRSEIATLTGLNERTIQRKLRQIEPPAAHLQKAVLDWLVEAGAGTEPINPVLETLACAVDASTDEVQRCLRYLVEQQVLWSRDSRYRIRRTSRDMLIPVLEHLLDIGCCSQTLRLEMIRIAETLDCMQRDVRDAIEQMIERQWLRRDRSGYRLFLDPLRQAAQSGAFPASVLSHAKEFNPLALMQWDRVLFKKQWVDVVWADHLFVGYLGHKSWLQHFIEYREWLAIHTTGEYFIVPPRREDLKGARLVIEMPAFTRAGVAQLLLSLHNEIGRRARDWYIRRDAALAELMNQQERI